MVRAAVDVAALRRFLHDIRVEQALEQVEGLQDVPVLFRAGLVVVAQQMPKVLVGVTVARKDVDEHRIGHTELRN